MLAKLVVFCAALAAVSACSTLQQIKVKSQWAQAFGESNSRENFGQAVWRAFFAQAPESRALFDRVNGDNVLSPDFQAHSLRVLCGIDMCFSLLDDDAVFSSALEHLKSQHDQRGLKGGYFSIMGESVIKAASATIGNCFDEDAWRSCFNKVASRIR